MSIYEKIKQNKSDKLDGKIKHIPCTIDRFNQYFYGIIKGDYICFTGSSSSGKTTLMKKMAVFDSIEYAIKTGLDLKILYFGLEESEEQFDYSMLAYLMKKCYNLRYNILDFNYINDGVQEEHLEFISEASKELEVWKSYVKYYDHTYNPYGIYKHIREFASSRGKFLYKGLEVSDNSESNWDSYSPNNPEEFIIVIADHISLLSTEAKHNNRLDEAMKDMSFYLRNYASKKFGYTAISVQQQFAESEDLDHIKANRWLPTLQGFGENKRLARDYLTVISIANPDRYKIKSYAGFHDLEFYSGFLRFVSILKQRYGAVDKTVPVYFDGKCGWIKAAPLPIETDKIKGFKEHINTLL